MRLADARFQQVQVLNTPGSGKDLAEGTGVHCEMGSEGSCFWYSFLRCGKQIILLFFMHIICKIPYFYITLLAFTYTMRIKQ